MIDNKEAIDLTFSRQKFKKKGEINFRGVSLSSTDSKYIVDSMSIHQVKKLKLTNCQIKAPTIKELVQGNWLKLHNLTIIQVKSNQHYDRGNDRHYRTNLQFGDAECRQLAKLTANDLKKIDLSDNNIGAEGCLYLTTSKWTKLTKLYLQCNHIGDQGCGYISRANWNIIELIVCSNIIKANGVKYLSKAHWSQLKILNLQQNKIRQVRCQWLSQSNWPNLTKLSLDSNNISKVGCRWLVKTNWKKLTVLGLSDNQFNWEGCQYLSIGHWQQIRFMRKSEEYIGDEGLLKLLKSDWKTYSPLFKVNVDFKTNIENGRFMEELCRKFQKQIRF